VGPPSFRQRRYYGRASREQSGSNDLYYLLAANIGIFGICLFSWRNDLCFMVIKFYEGVTFSPVSFSYSETNRSVSSFERYGALIVNCAKNRPSLFESLTASCNRLIKASILDCLFFSLFILCKIIFNFFDGGVSFSGID